MAKREIVVSHCDVDESEDNVHPQSFAVGSRTYVIDLCTEHQARFDASMAEWVKFAQAAGARVKTKRTKESRERAAAVREWARATGVRVADRGAIANSVYDQYDACH